MLFIVSAVVLFKREKKLRFVLREKNQGTATMKATPTSSSVESSVADISSSLMTFWTSEGLGSSASGLPSTTHTAGLLDLIPVGIPWSWLLKYAGASTIAKVAPSPVVSPGFFP